MNICNIVLNDSMIGWNIYIYILYVVKSTKDTEQLKGVCAICDEICEHN